MEAFVRAHRRQFIIGPALSAPFSDWRCVRRNDGLALSHCPTLPVADVRDRDGDRWWLLGRAVSAAPGGLEPPAAIAASGSAQVAGLVHEWAGRWLLVGPRFAMTDASALLGCLYGVAEDGALWMSSSPALLSTRLGAAALSIEDARTLLYERGVSWRPPPRTRFVGMRRLLPSQALDCADGSLAPRSPLPPVAPTEDVDAVADAISAALSCVLAGLAARSATPLWLGLTAGYDSRLVLALAVASGVNLRAYTRRTARMSLADRLIPPRLAGLAGAPFEVLFDRPPAGDRRPLVLAHALDPPSEGDMLPFLRGARDGLRGFSVGGHGFAIASGFSNWRRLPSEAPSPEEGARAIMALSGEPLRSTAALGLAEWLAWTARAPLPDLDWRDRMFLEQRQAGWLAAKEQIFDLQEVERVPILNAGLIFAHLLSLPPRLRLGSRLQERIVERVSPALAKAPYNPRDRAFVLDRPDLFAARAISGATRRLRRRLRAAARG